MNLKELIIQPLNPRARVELSVARALTSKGVRTCD